MFKQIILYNMINLRTEKLSKDLKSKLKTYLSLYKTQLRLYQHQSTIDKHRILYLLTSMQVIHFLFILIDAVKKIDTVTLDELKIGVIGGGVMGRLILNGIIPLSKQGFRLENVMLSTRQTENAAFFEKFGIQVLFDNKKVADSVDILFVCTPATLDNWILSEIGSTVKMRIYKKSNFKNRQIISPFTFIFTSGVNQEVIGNLFGKSCCFMLPSQTFKGVDQLYEHQQLWQIPHQSLNQFTIRQRAFKLFQSNSSRLSEVLTNFFLLKGDKSGSFIHPTIHDIVEKSTNFDEFFQKCKRFQNLLENI